MSKFISRSKKPIEPVWRQKNSAHISEKMNLELLAYLDSLPTELQEKIVVTSSTGDTHAKTSRHYKGAAFDLRIHNRENPYLDDLFLYFMKDSENRKNKNIVVVDPNHGSAPHIHISVGQGTENKLDFAHGENWSNYIEKGEFKDSKQLYENAMSNPIYGNLTAQRLKDPSYADKMADTGEQESDYYSADLHTILNSMDTGFDYNEVEAENKKIKVIQELQKYQQLASEQKTPDILYDDKVVELLEQQAQRNNAANLIKDYLTLDYEYENYSGEQKQEVQQTQGVQYAENGGVIQYPDGGKVNPPIYVDNRNDPRLKSYSDSLSLYNSSEKRLKEFRQFGDAHNLMYIYPSPGNYLPVEHSTIAPIDATGFVYNFSRHNPSAAVSVVKKDKSLSSELYGEASNLQKGLATNPSSKIPIYKEPQQPIKYRDPAIVAQQQQLIDAGYDIGGADGIWDSKSKKAWEQMQSGNQPTKEETTTENTPTEEKKAVVEQYVQNLPKQKPIGYIQVQGRNIPYYTQEELEPFKKYNPTKIGSSNNYAVSRHNEKTRGWTSDGELLDENNKIIYKTK